MQNPFRPSSQPHQQQVLTHSLSHFIARKKHPLPDNYLLRLCDIGHDQGQLSLSLWKELRKTNLKFHLLVLREGKSNANHTRRNIPPHAPITIIEKNHWKSSQPPPSPPQTMEAIHRKTFQKMMASSSIPMALT